MVNQELKITGLKSIAGESKNLHGIYSGEYLQINFNLSTHEAWSDYHYALGHTSSTLYDDKDIINCGNIYEPASMATIRELIENAVTKWELEKSNQGY